MKAQLKAAPAPPAREPVGRTPCQFAGGLVAGAVQAIVKQRTRARAVTCIGGLGNAAYGFELS
jgi:hypothetical protein